MKAKTSEQIIKKAEVLAQIYFRGRVKAQRHTFELRENIAEIELSKRVR